MESLVLGGGACGKAARFVVDAPTRPPPEGFLQIFPSRPALAFLSVGGASMRRMLACRTESLT
ncbi:hypothetical protein GCM10010486_67490 [Nonomuraea roseoviolacea subsp. carminata]